MIHTSRADTTILAYEDLHSVFDFNRTPLVPFGTKYLVFVDPSECTRFGPHMLNVFVVGGTPLHNCLIDLFCHDTRAHTPACTYKLYPTNYSMLVISKGDRTIIAAADLLDACKLIVPANEAVTIINLPEAFGMRLKTSNDSK